MTERDRPLALGDPVPDVRLQTFEDGETTLSAFHGRPLVVVCVRYFG